MNIRIPIVTVLAFMQFVSGYQYFRRSGDCDDLVPCHLIFCCGPDNGKIGTTSSSTAPNIRWLNGLKLQELVRFLRGILVDTRVGDRARIYLRDLEAARNMGGASGAIAIDRFLPSDEFV